LALVAVAAFSACAKPPAEAIAAAEAAQQSALAADAQDYAPEALHAVTEAKAALDAEIAAQGEKMAMTRSYKQAETLAASYKTAAEEAATAAASAKERARDDATRLITEGRASLDEVRGMLASAPRGKGSRADLAALAADLDAAGSGLTEAEGALTSEMYLDARTKASAAAALIAQVKTAVEQARAARGGR